MDAPDEKDLQPQRECGIISKCFEKNNMMFGDVPKWLKGPHSKCGRRVTPCESSNLSISAKQAQAYLLALVFHIEGGFFRKLIL